MNKIDSQEGKLLLALSALERGQFKSIRAAAEAYEIPNSTLRRRKMGVQSRVDSEANNLRLTLQEEQVLVQHILDLEARGFPPKLAAVRDMANFLLKTRSDQIVGANWPNKFVQRRKELRTRFSCRYDHQRAKCEDPVIMKEWFDLISTTIARYGIVDHDIYNFDETGFAMGLICRHLVVTGAEKRGSPKKIQPGNRNWTTVIAAISASGYLVPPYVIFAGKEHQEAWFSTDIPRDWNIGISKNGWTDNEHGLKWIRHFNHHTLSRTQGTHRLLIVDGHESHESLEFKQYCEANNIIPLCMPAHASHYLQPLDVGCFGPLKKAYGYQIEELARYGVNQITKTDFLPAFYAAWSTAMTESNIIGSFRGSGISPLDASVVIDKLEVNIREITPDLPGSSQQSIQQPKTSQNQRQFSFQTEMIKSRMLNIPGSSPNSVIDLVDQLCRGAEMIIANSALVKAEIVRLRKANELLSMRKARSKRRILGSLVLNNGDVLDRRDEVEIMAQIHREAEEGGTDVSRLASRRRCGLCREPGHRRETCQLRVINSEIS